MSPRGNLVQEETVCRDVTEAKRPVELTLSTFCISSTVHMETVNGDDPLVA